LADDPRSRRDEVKVSKKACINPTEEHALARTAPLWRLDRGRNPSQPSRVSPAPVAGVLLDSLAFTAK
jgi:hypothetical protein